MDEIANRLVHVQQRITAAANQGGRKPEDVTLVAVSKTVPLDRIRAAYGAGQRIFGENRVQEALAKIEAGTGEMPLARWHLIGHLQSNKAKQAAAAFALLESIDSVRLAQRLDRAAAGVDRTVPILLEVNVSGEESKTGFDIHRFWEDLPEIMRLERVSVQGLMTIAPLVEHPEQARPVFRALRLLSEEIRARYPDSNMQELSMGMSNDFEVAIQEGATMVRVGRALFGERPPAESRTIWTS